MDASPESPSATRLPPASPSQPCLRQLALVFTRLGFTAFGGPAAHVALMEEEIVVRRQWLDHQHFLDLIAAINFIPGPNSTEVAIHIGQICRGWRGLIVAGACFITPAMLIILPIAWAYVKWGARPQAQPGLAGIGAAIAAVVIFATWRFARAALKDSFAIVLAAGVALLVPLARQWGEFQPEIPCLMVAACAGIIRSNLNPRRIRDSMPLALALPIGFWPDLLRMAGSFLKIGATLFGSGYMLISYLQSGFIDRHGWLTSEQLRDAVAVGNFTPGPLLTTATFVGYLLGANRFAGGVAGGIIGGIVATAAIFAPSFILIAIFGPLLQKLRRLSAARGALDAMNAAVVGLMAIAALRLSTSALYAASPGKVHWLGVFILLGTLLGLAARLNAAWLILGAGLLGAVFGQSWF